MANNRVIMEEQAREAELQRYLESLGWKNGKPPRSEQDVSPAEAEAIKKRQGFEVQPGGTIQQIDNSQFTAPTLKYAIGDLEMQKGGGSIQRTQPGVRQIPGPSDIEMSVGMPVEQPSLNIGMPVEVDPALEAAARKKAALDYIRRSAGKRAAVMDAAGMGESDLEKLKSRTKDGRREAAKKMADLGIF